MPAAAAALERLIAEAELQVVTDELIRECIVVHGSDPELAEEERRSMLLSAAECACFSYRRLAHARHLDGLTRLTKLQLDNNSITRIEGLEQLTTLTWLDLSFNRITAIEGLGSLTRLVDLSLYSNQLEALRGLEGLTAIAALSLGCNLLRSLPEVSYLTMLPALQLLTLAGNPLASAAGYSSYILAQLPGLAFLDHERVLSSARAAAAETHADEVAEARERADAAAAAAAAAAESAAHAAAMMDANLEGVQGLLDELAATPEWRRLGGVPGLLEPWGDVRDKGAALTGDFKLVAFDIVARRKEEASALQAALDAALDERDARSSVMLDDYERGRKAAAVMAATRPGDAEQLARAMLAEGATGWVVPVVLAAKVKLMALQSSLLALEDDADEAAGELLAEHERADGELGDAARRAQASYCSALRDLLAGLHSSLALAAPGLLERFGGSGGGVGSGGDGAEPEALPEETAALLVDRETLTAALQAAQDAHTGLLDALEDRLAEREAAHAASLSERHAAWQEGRHRERMAELLAFLERGAAELDTLAADAADAVADAASGAAGGGGGGGAATAAASTMVASMSGAGKAS